MKDLSPSNIGLTRCLLPHRHFWVEFVGRTEKLHRTDATPHRKIETALVRPRDTNAHERKAKQLMDALPSGESLKGDPQLAGGIS